MSTIYTDVDRLILERWDDTKGLLEAYEELQDRMHDVIQDVGDRLSRWASAQQYVLEVDAKEPSYYLYKESWMNRRRDNGLVYFCLADFAPVGYRKVRHDHPHIWLCTENLQMIRLKESARVEFARRLRSNLGERAIPWMHEETKDADSPLGKYLTDVSDADRVQLLSEPEQLFGFATHAFEDAFPLSDAIEQTLDYFRSRE